MVAFARAEWARHSHLKPWTFVASFGGGGVQPSNPEIAQFTALYHHYKAVMLGKRKTLPSEHPEVIALADKTLKIAYVIGCLTLEELPVNMRKADAEWRKEGAVWAQESWFQTHEGAHLRQRCERPIFAQTIERQDFYMFRTITLCTQTYHHVRASG